jgi:hypothetical protein
MVPRAGIELAKHVIDFTIEFGGENICYPPLILRVQIGRQMHSSGIKRATEYGGQYQLMQCRSDPQFTPGQDEKVGWLRVFVNTQENFDMSALIS